MSRARTQNHHDLREVNPHPQTAAAPEDGSGCLSGFMIPPLAVLLVSCLLAAFIIRQPPSLRDSTVTVVTPPLTTYGANSSGLAQFFTLEVLHWSDSIARWATASALDPNLVAVIMQIESCGDPRARSGSGAMGLFQVMPFHFQATDNPYHPDTNAQRGLAYLSRALQAARGNPRLAMAGYNGGIGVIERAEWTWSAQTKRYVYYGAPIYEDARGGSSTSMMLDEWYTKYGAGLCAQAHQRLGLP